MEESMKKQTRSLLLSAVLFVIATSCVLLLAACGTVQNAGSGLEVEPKSIQPMSLTQEDNPPPLGIVSGTGTSFQITDSAYLNLGVESDIPITVRIESIPSTVTLSIEPAAPGASTNLSLSGLEPSRTYYVYPEDRLTYSTLTSDANGTAKLAVELNRPRLLFLELSPSTVFIYDNGGYCANPPSSVVPFGIWNSSTKTCTLTRNIEGGVYIQGGDITIDGAGYTVMNNNPEGRRSGIGIYVWSSASLTSSNIEIKNLYLTGFSEGIRMAGAVATKVHGVTFDDVSYGIYLHAQCTMTQYDSSLDRWVCTSYLAAYDNVFYSNDFLSHTYRAIYSYEGNYPEDKKNRNKAYLGGTGGNFYWDHVYYRRCSDTNNDGTCDSGINNNNSSNIDVPDLYPLTRPLSDWPVATVLPYSSSSSYKDSSRSFNASASYNPGGGSLTFNWDFGDGATAVGSTAQHTYAPAVNYSLQATVTVTNKDGKQGRSRQFVHLYNQSPRANSDSLTVYANESGTVDVLANDWDYETALAPSTLKVYEGLFCFRDISTQPCTYETAPRFGNTELGATSGTITYTPDEDFIGNDWFYYTICDDDTPQGCSHGYVNVTVRASNRPPSLSVSQASITVPEGSQAVNNGTFSDLDGDNVTLSASVGNIGKGSGTWTWSFKPTDDMAEQTVNITATDSHNASTTVSFKLAAYNVAPSFDAGDDVTLTGSSTLTRSVTFTDPGADSWSAEVNYGDGTTKSLSSISSPLELSHTYSASDTYTVSVTIRDDDGGSTTDSFSVTVVLDSTPPEIIPTITGTLGNNDWHISDVTLTWSVVDDESTITSQSGCDEVNITADQAATEYTCTATSAGGTSEETVTIKRDATTPEVVDEGPTTSANTHDWYNSAVLNTFTASDAISGLANPDQASFTVSTGTAEGTAVKINSGPVSDVAGNSNPGIDSQEFQIDLTAPTITASLNTSASGTGWYNISTGAPTVIFGCEDALSGLDGACPGSHTFGEGASQSHSGSVTDKAGNGNSAEVSGINVDLTAPTNISFSGISNGNYFYRDVNVPALSNLSCSANYGVSGPGSCVIEGYSNSPGVHTLTARATDAAGNEATETLTYRVHDWRIDGFHRPVEMDGTMNVVRNGSTVPLKFNVFVDGIEITSTAKVSMSVVQLPKAECSTTTDESEFTETTTGGTSLRYATSEFVYNWQTPKRAGNCYSTTMTYDGGPSVKTKFRLR
jgi:hypothetical protein